MAVRKIAISVPEDILRQVDRLAKKSKTTRSALIARVLKEVSHASRQNDLTAQINEFFENEDLLKEQSKTTSEFLGAVRRDDEGSEW